MRIASKKPTVSIIIPVYNRVDCLRRSIASVINQKFKDWELIIVDDGSSENIELIADETRNKIDQNVIFLRQDNQGPGCARRNGLMNSSGEFVQYLDSDDEIMPEKILKQILMMQKAPNSIMCYCSSIQFAKNGNKYIRIFSDQHESSLLKGALEWRRWSTSSCLWRYPEIRENYWSNYYNGEDLLHDVTVGILFCNKEVSFVPEPLVVINFDIKSVSHVPNNDKRADLYRQAILNIKVDCYELLRGGGLIKNKKYTIPLAERFFHSGLLLLRLNDTRRGINALQYCNRLSKFHLRNFFSCAAIIIALITNNHFPILYSYMFKVYKKLIPKNVHFGRSV